MDDMTKKIRIVYGDAVLGLHAGGCSLLCSYAAGGPVSLCLEGREWLYRAPRPAFWRATTDNDRGNGFPLRSGQWLGADLFIRCTDVRVEADGKEIPVVPGAEHNTHSDQEYVRRAAVTYYYETITAPAARAEVSYRMDGEGRITVSVCYHGAKGLPELPVFGLRMTAPTLAAGFRYQGLSGETYPDRMAGGVPGVYEVPGLPVTPYLVPQDCGMHMETQWVEILRDTFLDNREPGGAPSVLRISCTDRPFAFSCLPYTAQELENATHQEELPPARRTVLTVFGAVRGVGGIDSWGADVGDAYRVSGEGEMAFSFIMEAGRQVFTRLGPEDGGLIKCRSRQ